MNKMTEEDVKVKYITPALQNKDWDPKTQMRFEYYDAGSHVYATGSTTVDNVYGNDYDDRYNVSIDEFYNDSLDGLFVPSRFGYKFINWHRFSFFTLGMIFFHFSFTILIFFRLFYIFTYKYIS